MSTAPSLPADVPPPPPPVSSSSNAAPPEVISAALETQNGIDDDDDLDIEKLLAEEASLLTREQEVERVLKAFKLNPYEILDLPFGKQTTTDMIRESSLVSQYVFMTLAERENEPGKSYRKRSLLIHPDKFKHDRGIEAFDILKKAETELNDGEKRKCVNDFPPLSLFFANHSNSFLRILDQTMCFFVTLPLPGHQIADTPVYQRGRTHACSP
jgi:DnaJ family protein C protein 8